MYQALSNLQPINDSVARSLSRIIQWQWVRYGLAGASSATVDLGMFYLLSIFVYPCLADSLGDSVRAYRFVVDKTFAFAIANVFSYWLNARYVFTPGRHRRVAEIVLFFTISLISCLLGMQLGRTLIGNYGMTTSFAAIICIAFATVINFGFRKLLVFRG